MLLGRFGISIHTSNVARLGLFREQVTTAAYEA